MRSVLWCCDCCLASRGPFSAFTSPTVERVAPHGGGVAQLAEATVSDTVQCEFTSIVAVRRCQTAVDVDLATLGSNLTAPTTKQPTDRSSTLSTHPRRRRQDSLGSRSPQPAVNRPPSEAGGGGERFDSSDSHHTSQVCLDGPTGYDAGPRSRRWGFESSSRHQFVHCTLGSGSGGGGRWCASTAAS